MRRSIVLLMALMIGLVLTSCGDDPPTQETTAIKEHAEEAVQQRVELVGLWHLDDEKNDLATFADSLELFPGYGEWGAGMEIRSNGQMSWYIGAEGWHGTYAVEGETLHAQLTSDLEQSVQLWDLRVITENEKITLEMPYDDMTICWVYGDQEDRADGNEE